MPGHPEAIWVVTVGDRAVAALRSRQAAEAWAEEYVESRDKELITVPRVEQLTLMDRPETARRRAFR